MKTIVAFGEILGRFSPQQGRRLRQTLPGALDLTFAGAEANVAAALSLFGARARLVSALPDHPLADASVGFYAGLGVQTDFILRRASGRMGLYFYEPGASQRAGEVIYDREGSTICQTPADEYPWDQLFADAGTLFLTGITPGLSAVAAEATLRAADEAKRRGIRVVFDLNFRRKLWQWREGTSPTDLAREIMTPLVERADLLLANEGSAFDIFSLQSEGDDAPETSRKTAEKLAALFPNLTMIAMTMRESISASHNRWGALLYQPDGATTSVAPLGTAGAYQPYEITPIIDRVGAGDAFAAGLIYALGTPELCAPDQALAFATAASCLSHSVPGDVTYMTRGEVESLMNGDGSGRVRR